MKFMKHSASVSHSVTSFYVPDMTYSVAEFFYSFRNVSTCCASITSSVEIEINKYIFLCKMHTCYTPLLTYVCEQHYRRNPNLQTETFPVRNQQLCVLGVGEKAKMYHRF